MSDSPSFAPPPITPETAASLRAYWAFYEPHAGEIQKELLHACASLPAWAPLLRALRPEVLQEQHLRSVQLQRRALVDGDWQPYLTDAHAQGAQYAKAGTKFAAWFEIISLFRNCVRRRLGDLASSDLNQATKIGDGMNAFFDIAMANIGEAYLSTKEQIIRQQEEAIREISTPVLQVRDQLLIIPVVGLVDTHRARLLTEGLLTAIRDRRARGVVMDITGVPIVDSKVANHLAQACEAARLMGALVVMTGISAEIAQTLVTIGAQLRGVRTVGDLQGGIEEVERFLSASPGV